MKCGKKAEERFEQPAYRAINAWLASLTKGGSAPVDALMFIPEDSLGINVRLDTIDATVDIVLAVQIKRRKKKERPKLVMQ